MSQAGNENETCNNNLPRIAITLPSKVLNNFQEPDIVLSLR